MKLQLKDFQANAVDDMYRHAQYARQEAETGGGQAIVLSSPTGSGKTMIATAFMERLVEGDGDHAPDPDATFLWLTDQPDLNEQSRRKILAASTVFDALDLVTIEADFDHERLDPGKVYFLNIQKLGRSTNLVTPGDARAHSIWETVTNTVEAFPGSFWLVLDEAHKGMLEKREAREAATIVQKFIKGSPGEIPPVPLILGISATPERFVDLLRGTARVPRNVLVSPDDVRASGLLKETILLYHPTERQPSDWSLLSAAAEKLKVFADRWATYSARQREIGVRPVLVVQVEDAASSTVTRSDLSTALRVLEKVLGPLADSEIAHSFQEGHAVEAGPRALRYVSPADIQDDASLRVVFFKLSLNTGWDCPRAEVIMSFRKAVDYTRIAQLVGRLVRTPLARLVSSDDFLNSVALYLPHYDAIALQRVIEYLSSPETGVAAPPDVIEGQDVQELGRNPAMEELFRLAQRLPTYVVERVSRISYVRRLMRLGRALAYDELDPAAPSRFREMIVSVLDAERARHQKAPAFKKAVRDQAQLDLRAVEYAVGGQVKDESFERIALLNENIDDLHSLSARKLGEGLHQEYVKARVASGRVDPPKAKVELATLLQQDGTLQALEALARTTFDAEMQQHHAAIRDLPDSRKDAYRRLRLLAPEREAVELELPQFYQSRTGTRTFALHLYTDDSGTLSCNLNELEARAVQVELARGDVAGWLRNLPRKTWSFAVPYTYNGQPRPLFPDFLFFRRRGKQLIVDILDPHSLHLEDSAERARGMAEFAAKHGDLFERIELIAEEGGSLMRLDVNRAGTRQKVLTVTNSQQLRLLFERAS